MLLNHLFIFIDMKNFQIFLMSLCVLLFFSCETETTPDNRILSGDYVDGVLFVSYDEDGFPIEIRTSTPAKFFPSTSKNTFEIEESGEDILDLDPGLYWIDIVWENGMPLRESIPVYITRNKDEAIETVSALKNMKNESNGFVIVLRHANASVGEDIVTSNVPEWWKSCDSGVARQLSELGKSNALKIGTAIKNLSIPVSATISSEFCRSVQTFENMNLGLTIEQDARLNHENESKKLVMWEDVFQVIKDNPQSNGVLALVGHYNMYAENPYRSSIRPFNQSDGFLMKYLSSGELEFVGSIPVYMWDIFL
jgi:phosphohistidine phosphatase SixA